MKSKSITCVILLATIIVGLSGCVQQTPSTPFTGEDVKFYTASGTVGKMQISMAQISVYNSLIGLPTGWYTLGTTPKKVSGYVDNEIGLANRQLSVYYVGTLSNNQKVVYSIEIQYDTPIGETYTPKDQGYPFVIETNQNKATGFY